MVTNEFIAIRALRAGAKILKDSFGRYKIRHRMTGAELSPDLFRKMLADGLIEKAERKPEHFVDMWELAKTPAAIPPGERDAKKRTEIGPDK